MSEIVITKGLRDSSGGTHGQGTMLCIPVLATWSSMKIDDEFETVVAGPGYRVLQVRQLALDVWFSRANLKSPISYW